MGRMIDKSQFKGSFINSSSGTFGTSGVNKKIEFSEFDINELNKEVKTLDKSVTLITAEGLIALIWKRDYEPKLIQYGEYEDDTEDIPIGIREFVMSLGFKVFSYSNGETKITI